MNVLIYSGSGSTQGLALNLSKFLSKILGERYAISTISGKELSDDPWPPNTKLLILPGGWEPPYIPHIPSQAKLKIIDFVSGGGKFVGLCAERYDTWDGSPGEDNPGTGVGSVTFMFPFLSTDNAPINCPSLYSRGGYFVDAENHDNTMVLATYGIRKQPSRAAAVLCQVGSNGGQALLSFVHPEHVMNPKFLKEGEQDCTPIVELVYSRWLRQLGLNLNSERFTLRITPISLSHVDKSASIPLSNKTKSTLQQVYQDLLQASSSHSGLLEDNSTFCIQWYSDDDPIRFNVPQQDSANNLTIVGCPDPARILGVTFHPARYLKFLQEAYAKPCLVKRNPNIPSLGCQYFMGILVENPKLRQHLSPGAVFVAGRQMAAKGRGKNSWVSPLGCCQFSCYLEHPMFNVCTSPVLIQFLGALAVVGALRQKPGYEDLALRIKWPNDIYGVDYSSAGSPTRKKVGGVLLSSFYDGGSLALILGIGINVTNQQPTMCVNDLVAQLNRKRGPFHLCRHFLRRRWLHRYYSYWLHRASLTLSQELVVTVDPTTSKVNPWTCQHFELQPDGNSFDLMTGMISLKVN
ncbi:biotin holocarboxylase synthetase [Massospora cicadina]|nr:biotin holocarboxylase synthetase [Massospora cicadina]